MFTIVGFLQFVTISQPVNAIAFVAALQKYPPIATHLCVAKS
jgi:hypothetical protein